MTPLFRELETTVSGLERDWQALHSLPEDAKLYHFTRPEGLTGIISSGALRATLATDFADTGELRHPTTSLGDEDPKPETWKQPWWKGLGPDYLHDPIWESVEAWQSVKGPFVSCFCRCNPTDLGSNRYMWEKFAEEGKGFALGIRFTPAETPTGVERWCLRKVLYGQTQWENPLTQVSQWNESLEVFRKRVERARLIAARGLPDGLLNPCIEDCKRRETAEIDSFQARLHRLQMELAACTKSVGFSSEQEIRLLVYQVDQPKKRKEKPDKVVSYIEVPIANLPSESSGATQFPVRLELEEIVVGPAADTRRLEVVVDQIADPQVISVTGSPAVRIRHCQGASTACSL